MSEHAKLPWAVDTSGIHDGPVIRDAEGFYVCECGQADFASDYAAFIVRAANSHNELLAVCKAALKFVPPDVYYACHEMPVAVMLREAIAAAEGE